MRDSGLFQEINAQLRRKLQEFLGKSGDTEYGISNSQSIKTSEKKWRSIKYEDIYPKGYNNLKEVGVGLKNYFQFYNESRPHQVLEYRTPAEVY